MRTIIAGSRDIVDERELVTALGDCGWIPSVVLTGRARGADILGERWARRNGVFVEPYPAKWKNGKGTGLERNRLMADNAEALIALWDGVSPGTAHMIKIAQTRGLRVHVRLVKAQVPAEADA